MQGGHSQGHCKNDQVRKLVISGSLKNLSWAYTMHVGSYGSDNVGKLGVLKL